MEATELGGEACVLLPQAVLVAAVEPHERVLAAKQRRDARQRQQRAVLSEESLVPLAEHRLDVVRLLVAGPALQHAELRRVVQADVQRSVAALREPPSARAQLGIVR
jgi:hypothetical protein